MPALVSALQMLSINPNDGELQDVFFAKPEKTKLEQFFRLLYLIQKTAGEEKLPMTVGPPGIAQTLIAAKVFTDPTFPNQIVSVSLAKSKSSLRYAVHFNSPEVRFPLNQGIGFAVWDHGKCQWARELVFHDGFSFGLSEKGKNLVVSDFAQAQLYGDFGARGILDIDLNYVDLEKVEFIAGTDQGKVKSRVAEREFTTNPHSFLFRFVGRLIPDTSRQRIDW